MPEANLSAPRSVRAGVFIAVAALHLLAIAVLIRAFAPDLASKAVDAAITTFSVTVTTVEPSPAASPPAQKSGASSKAGEAGLRAVAQEVAVPRARVMIALSRPAPQVASTGLANSAGARGDGAGTGAGWQGVGSGSGGAGSGQGTGGGAKAAKIAGDINSARDFPIATRELRIGDYVLILVTVGTDGRPTGCRVGRPSRDSEADAITCRLALERFRFRAATNEAGQPIVSTYGWQQRWFYKN